MSVSPSQSADYYLSLAVSLASEFAIDAVERDHQGGTPKLARDRLRQSGLLTLLIPREYGGSGESWITLFRIVREFAQVDSSIAHIFSYHHLGVIVPHLFGTIEQREYYYKETIRQNWFWANALNPLDRRTAIAAEGDIFRLEGKKSFCSGSWDSDILPVTAIDQETGKISVLVVPTQREGVELHADWDNMGQRQTDSGSVSFHNVAIYPREFFGSQAFPAPPFATFRACLTQLNLANIYLGIALGAFEAARRYTREQTRPWLTAGVERATEAPYLLHRYGSLWVDLEAARGLVDRATEILQDAWEEQWHLTAEKRGRCAVAIAVAKVAATRVGLEVVNQMFEVMGARATSSSYGFDRYWRNLRTFTLHDPVDYKIRDLGNWIVNEKFPEPNFYS